MEKKKSLKERIICIYYHCLWRRWIKLKKKNRIFRYPIVFTSCVFFIIFILLVLILLFGLSGTYPKGEEYPWLSTIIETRKGIDLNCSFIFENYKEGDITMYVAFEKKEGNDNKIYLYFNRDLSNECLEKSYIQVSMPKEKEFPMKRDENGRPYWYYFDLSEASSKDFNSKIRIFFGKNFLNLNKERIVLHEYLTFSNFSKLEEINSIQFLFPSEWNIISCPENESVSILDSRSHRIISKAKDVHNVYYFIEFERNYGKIALRDTKIGILMTLIFAGITLILSIYLYEKKQK